jgi:glycerol uptake facilitator-like aquaporin
MIKQQHARAVLSAIVISSILVASFMAITSQFQHKAFAQSSSSNPLTKVPVIGKLMSGGSSAGNATTNATSPSSSGSSAGNATSGNQSSSSNPLAKVPVIGKLFGSK